MGTDRLALTGRSNEEKLKKAHSTPHGRYSPRPSRKHQQSHHNAITQLADTAQEQLLFAQQDECLQVLMGKHECTILVWYRSDSSRIEEVGSSLGQPLPPLPLPHR